MTIKTVLTRNTVSGVVGYVPESYLTHPVFSQQLEKVEAGTKSFVPELYKAKDADKNEVGEDAKKKASDKPTSDTENR